MSDMFKLILALAEAGVVRRGRKTIARAALTVILCIGALLCFIAALGCAFAALWIYLAPRLGAVAAPLVVAGVLVVLCLVLLGVMRYAPRAGRRPPAQDDGSAQLLAEASRLLKEHKGSVLTGAIVAGLIAGMSRK